VLLGAGGVEGTRDGVGAPVAAMAVDVPFPSASAVEDALTLTLSLTLMALGLGLGPVPDANGLGLELAWPVAFAPIVGLTLGSAPFPPPPAVDVPLGDGDAVTTNELGVEEMLGVGLVDGDDDVLGLGDGDGDGDGDGGGTAVCNVAMYSWGV